MCELTNHSRLGIWEGGALKRQNVSDRGGIQSCYCILSITACKAILVVTQNKLMYLKMSIICLC